MRQWMLVLCVAVALPLALAETGGVQSYFDLISEYLSGIVSVFFDALRQPVAVVVSTGTLAAVNGTGW